jgi:hypothetical protein
MFAWLRNHLGRVDYEVPPREHPALSAPPPDAASVAAAIAGVDMRLRELMQVPKGDRTPEQWAEIDRLLDRRMRLVCPPVPVIPGRPT